jgi:streptogramin lyase
VDRRLFRRQPDALRPRLQGIHGVQAAGPDADALRHGVDHDDNVWYASMYTDVMGRLDPKTGKVTEYPSPYGERGTRDMVVDAKGRIWYGAQPYFKAGYVRVRTAAEKSPAPGR